MGTNLEVAQLLDIPEAEYHADYSRVSHSMLEVFIESPRLYRGRFITREFPPKQSEAFDFGKAAHAMVLEDRRVYVPIPPDALSRKGRRQGAAWDAFKAQHVGKILLKTEQQVALEFMVAEIRRHPRASRIVNCQGVREQTIHWTDAETGLPMKCRLDIMPWPLTFLADLKTCESVDPHKWATAVRENGYHRQQDTYQDAAEALLGERPPFFFVPCMKSAPYTVKVRDLSDDLADLARHENRDAIRRLVECMETDNWDEPNYGEIETTHKPRWRGDY